MDLISTAKLAKKLDLSNNDLIGRLKTLGWIENKNDKLVLTELGKQKGGQVRTSSQYGDFIVWPEDIKFDSEKPREKEEIKEIVQKKTKESAEEGAKLINSTKIGEHFGVSAERLNLILSEIGLIERVFVGQRPNGWKVTKFGVSVGGRNYEHDKKGTAYVMWPQSILQNKNIIEAFHDTHEEKSKELPPPQQLVNTNQGSDDVRKLYPTMHRTKDGHYVRSKAEVIIDNYLYDSGIVHAYERKVPNIPDDMISDFYLPAGKVFIEYWGIENDKKYEERKKKKIEIYKKYGVPLIELNDHEVSNLDDHLPRKLKDFDIKVY